MTLAVSPTVVLPARARGQRSNAPGIVAVLATVAATVAVTFLGVSVPLAVSVLGLVLFGALHNVLEIRQVLGTFTEIVTPSWLALLGVLVGAIMLGRLVGPAARPLEITVGYAVLGLALLLGQRSGRSRAATATFAVILFAAAWWSWRHPAWHMVILTHVHNLVPVVFLWWWAQRLEPGPRRAFRVAQLGWAVLVPALVLAGLADSWLRPDPAFLAGFQPGAQAVASGVAVTGTDAVVATRLLMTFAITQTMHYLTWVVFFPLADRPARVAFERRWPMLTNRRVWLVALALGGLLAAVFLSDFATGRAWYAVFTVFHVYLEFPLLLAVLLGTLRSERRSP